MSAPSGIKVPTAVSDAFAGALRDQSATRAVVFLIEGENYKTHATISPKGSFKDDIALLLPALPNAKTCASFAYRTDDREWYLITYVPDDAGVRQKMLQASSKAGLLKALGEGRFKTTMFFTSPSDLTPQAFSAHLSHLSAPPPLTASEAALAQIKLDEEAEAKRSLASGIPSQAERARLSGVKGVGLKMGEDVRGAVKALKEGGAQGRAVLLQINSPTETLTLHLSESLSPSALASKIPAKEPCFTFYAWPSASTGPSRQSSVASAAATPAKADPPASADADIDPAAIKLPESTPQSPTEGTPPPNPISAAFSAATASPSAGDVKILFIYTCPSASAIKHRMLYSASIRSTIKDVEEAAGIKVVKRLETSDISDLTESYLKSELASVAEPARPAQSASLPFRAGGFQSTGRQFPIPQPQRTSSATSAVSGVSDAATVGSSTSNGSLPDSAFSAFGPRVSSPGAGFARPKPAGRR